MSDNKNTLRHIAIAGNIGAGKTTLTELLGRHFGWETHFESTTNNPYLNDFYTDMERWSFNLQIFFLNSRFRQVLSILNGDKTVIQDRTIYEDAHIFAPNLYEMGLMAKRDFDNYISLFDLMKSQIKAPDLLIYLKCSIPTLVKHIQNRGRAYEGNMSLDYLKKLNYKYESWIDSYSEGELLIINADEVDFMENEEDLGLVIEQTSSVIHGLF